MLVEYTRESGPGEGDPPSPLLRAVLPAKLAGSSLAFTTLTGTLALRLALLSPHIRLERADLTANDGVRITRISPILPRGVEG